MSEWPKVSQKKYIMMLKSFYSTILLFSFLASGGLPWGIPVHSQHQGYEGWYPTLTLTLTSLLHFCPTLWVCTQHERSWKRNKTYLLHPCPTSAPPRWSTQSGTPPQTLPACSLSPPTLHTATWPIQVHHLRHQHVRDAQDNIKRLWCFWRYFKYIIISSHVTMMDMIIWWCAGHSHTGELQVFDCINLASRVSPFLHQPLPYTTAEKQFWIISLFFRFPIVLLFFLLSQSFTPVRRASPMNLIWESHLSGIRSFNFNFSSFCKFDPIQCKGEENDRKSKPIN